MLKKIIMVGAFAFLLTSQLFLSSMTYADDNSSEQVKKNVAVLTLKNKEGVTVGEAEAITDKLSNELFNTGLVNIIEREQIDQILKEQNFSKSGAVDEAASIAKIGKLLNINQIVMGSIGKVGSNFLINLRVVDVQTAQVSHVTSLDINGMDAVVSKLSDISRDLVGLKGQKPKDQKTDDTHSDLYTTIVNEPKHIEQNQKVDNSISTDQDTPKWHPEISGFIGKGFLDGYNTGFGGRLTLISPSNLLLGVTLASYNGKKSNGTITFSSTGTEVGGYNLTGVFNYYSSASILTVGADIGYNFPLNKNVSINFYLEPGYAHLKRDDTLTYSGGTLIVSTPLNELYFAPGAQFKYTFNSGFFIGADARYTIVLGDDSKGYNYYISPTTEPMDTYKDAFDALGLFFMIGYKF